MNNDERGYEMAIENIERQLTERFFQHMELLQAIKALGITEEVRAKVDELAKENFVPQSEHGLHLFDIDENGERTIPKYRGGYYEMPIFWRDDIEQKAWKIAKESIPPHAKWEPGKIKPSRRHPMQLFSE